MFPRPAIALWSSSTAFSGARRPASAAASSARRSVERVRTEPRQVGIEPDPPEPAGIVQPHEAPVVQAHRPTGPTPGPASCRCTRAGRSPPSSSTQQPPGHPEVQPDDRTVGAQQRAACRGGRRRRPATPAPRRRRPRRRRAGRCARRPRPCGRPARRRPAGSARPPAPPARTECGAIARCARVGVTLTS